MPLEVQAKFLRAIQEGEIRPVGSTQLRRVEVRVIAAGCLENYAWPGNVRELENLVERTVILAALEVDLIGPELLPPDICSQIPETDLAEQPGRPSPGVKTMKDAFEKMTLLEVLMKNGWNQSAVPRELEIDEKSMRYKMHKLGIRKPG